MSNESVSDAAGAAVALTTAYSKPTAIFAPHQQRVVTEKAELDEKISKLRAFIDTPIFGDLVAAEKGRLWQQIGVMRWYSQILGERIAAF